MEEDKIEKLKQLHDLYTANVLSESEFQSMKSDILNDKEVDIKKSEQGASTRSSSKKSHKGIKYTVIILLILIISGGAGIGYASWHSKPADTSKSTSNSKKEKVSSSSSQTASSQESTQSSTSVEKPKQISLTESQKEQISSEFLNWAAGRAEMGNMAVSSEYFNHGAGGTGDWYANTPDGEVQAQDQNNPGSDTFPIHAIGGVVFLTMKDGSTGLQDGIIESTAGGYSDNADMSMPITKYLLGDNGKVYELKADDGKIGLSSGFGEYSDDGKESSFAPTDNFVVSEDEDAQAELQQLIKQYS